LGVGEPRTDVDVDPEGDFVEAIGRNFTADQAAKVISDHIKDWEGPLYKKDRWA
jgi:protein SCO1/2